MSQPFIFDLRDIKYDIDLIGVHGASYRHMGTDPVLEIPETSIIKIEDRKEIHTARFRVRSRKLNHVECYGGIESLEELRSIADSTTVETGNLVFPVARGAGGTALPILIPIARLNPRKAAVTLAVYNGVPPDNEVVLSFDAEIFVDWEMSHRSHRLLFDTPGYHIGVRGTWQKEGKPVRKTAVWLELDSKTKKDFLSSLRLVLEFDDFVRESLQPGPAGKSFLNSAQELYESNEYESRFGHPFELPNFIRAMEMIEERVVGQKGLQEYYGIG
jgi:hypothetical protein